MSEGRRPDPALSLLSPAERARAASLGPQHVALLAFEVGGVRHALELHRTREILRGRRATALPGLPAYVEGVIAVRGEIMPLVDLARRLGAGPTPPSPRSRILVVAAVGGARAGLRVESVQGVLRLRPELVQAAPPGVPFLRALTGEPESARVLDLDALLDFRAPRLG